MNVSPVIGGKIPSHRHRPPVTVMPGRRKTPHSPVSSPPSGDQSKSHFDEIPPPNQNSHHVTKMAIEVMEENQRLREEMENLKKQHIREIEKICSSNNGSQEEFETDPKSLLSKMMRQSLYAEEFLTEEDSSELSRNRVEELQIDLDKANKKISDLLEKLKEKDETIAMLQAEIRTLKTKDQTKRPVPPQIYTNLQHEQMLLHSSENHKISQQQPQSPEELNDAQLDFTVKSFIPKKFSPRAPPKRKNSQEVFDVTTLKKETQIARKRNRRFD